MARNSGKSSEGIFEAHWDSLGKKAFCKRFDDQGDLYGRNNKKMIVTNPQPADYIVTAEGRMFYAEVKSVSEYRFPFSMIRKGQWAGAKRTVAAGGWYCFFIHNVPSNQWWIAAAETVLAAREAGCASIRLDFLTPWKPNASV